MLARATEKELERSRERLAEAERIGRIGHWHYDPVGHTAVWSDGFYWLVGHQPGSFPVTFDAFLTCLHPDDRAGVLEAVGEARRTRTRRSQSFRAVWPDGTVRHLTSSIEVGLGPDGSITKLFGTAVDTTESEAAGHEIERSVNQL